MSEHEIQIRQDSVAPIAKVAALLEALVRDAGSLASGALALESDEATASEESRCPDSTNANPRVGDRRKRAAGPQKDQEEAFNFKDQEPPRKKPQTTRRPETATTSTSTEAAPSPNPSAEFFEALTALLKTAQPPAKKSDPAPQRTRAEIDLLFSPRPMFYESVFTADTVLSSTGHGVDSVLLHQLYVFEIGAILIRLFQDRGQSAVDAAFDYVKSLDHRQPHNLLVVLKHYLVDQLGVKANTIPFASFGEFRDGHPIVFVGVLGEPIRRSAIEASQRLNHFVPLVRERSPRGRRAGRRFFSASPAARRHRDGPRSRPTQRRAPGRGSD
eukprot:gnl/Ergobibamus_cyprinoides/461.p1 GENE.gnl/Ergobibamus_cyprinoides/461~~gnl/Ergobibamus_cyprinoides/461.p1  ORF type:complete len:329 (+),score=19.96 gnl/Ergobibamus_cyprinoides/461:128-1114(+)